MNSKNKLYLIISAFCLSAQFSAKAQVTYSAIEYLDVNNIKASALVHGDFWYDPSSQTSKCEYPKGSGKSVAFAAALWMSGYDTSGNLHVAAQGYRQKGNDFWPGPLSSNGTTNATTVQNWAKIWKINRSTIDSFRQLTSHTISNTPQSILEWPAKGNPYAKGNNSVALTIPQDMAPFVDVNSDNSYNPLQGDYPAIKGDQMLWLVYNDNAWAHANSQGMPLGVEIQVSAFGYNRGTDIDNVLYYDFKLLNKSSADYNNFRLAMFSDMDMGYAFDDYIGYDSVHRMGIVYNAKSPDGNGEPTSYGNNVPIAGISMINLPGDSGGNSIPAGCFNTFTNGSPVNGDPTNAIAYNNLIRSKSTAGMHIKNPITGDSTVKYLLPDDPQKAGGWSECQIGDTAGDRRFIITSNDFTLERNSNKTVTMALVVQKAGSNNTCPNAGFTQIKNLADTAWKVYNNPLAAPSSLSTPLLSSAKQGFNIYPNPATETLHISTKANNKNATIIIYDGLGKALKLPATINNNNIEVDIHSLPAGIYTILYRNEEMVLSKRFVKE